MCVRHLWGRVAPRPAHPGVQLISWGASRRAGGPCGSSRGAGLGTRRCLILVVSLLLLVLGSGVEAVVPTGTDRTALEALYEATNGVNWPHNTNWTTDEGDWYGVTTDAAGNVTVLDLRANGLSGPIPEALGQLTHLTQLYLYQNELSGPIPEVLGQLTNLTRLDLAQNELSGPIPEALGQLTHLTQLYLYQNELSGPIPEVLGQLTNLTLLDLAQNELSGPIPEALGQLTHLTHLYLAQNELSGPIPEALGQLTHLTQLALAHNELSGPIPEALGQLTHLTHLYLAQNELSGPIPEALGQLTHLTQLYLYQNELSGPIPEALGQLTHLTQLYLYQNELSGPIPEVLGQLTNLTQLALAHNELSGPIPEVLGQLTNLTRLDLAQNELSGPIPEVLGQLTNLTQLYLYQNELSGPIPEALGQLTNLTLLDLAQNELSGPIPEVLGQLTNLTHLYLHQNTLSGPIPEALGQLTNLTQLALHQNTLSGPIPEVLGQLTNLTHLYLYQNELSGPIPEALGQLTHLTHLYLHQNTLSGPIPEALGNLRALVVLNLAHNPALGGPLPLSFAHLAVLQELSVQGTGLTVPADMALQEKLAAIAFTPAQPPGVLENPGPTSFQSGLGVIAGWVCEAEEVELELGHLGRQAAGYGTERVDTEAECGDVDNGFGLLFNWNRLGDGEHEVVAWVDDVERGRVTVTVTTLGEDFVRGVAGECSVPDFPLEGETVTVVWQQSQQNFVIVEGAAPTSQIDAAGLPGVGYLENPGANSFQSGLGVISGWVCEAEEVELELGHLGPQPAAYGTERVDTESVCGDTDNGFGLLFNWNRLGVGEHEVVAFVDGEELGRATVRVTTVGAGAEEEFLRGVAGECSVPDFPLEGETVTVVWQQTSQNFVITDVE